MGRHLLFTNWRVTSSEAILQTLPKIAFIDRLNERLAFVTEHLNCRCLTSQKLNRHLRAALHLNAAILESVRALDHILLPQKFHDDISNGSRVTALTNTHTLKARFSDATQLNSTSSWVSWVEPRRRRYRHFADAAQLDVELSCVAINGPLDTHKRTLPVLKTTQLATLLLRGWSNRST